MALTLFILIAALALVVKSATLATKYAARLASGLKVSRYVIGFIIVAVISIMPETFIAVGSAIEGHPELGLGTLFGGNVADLTLVFTAVVLLARRNLKIDSTILKEDSVLPFLMLIPVALGLDGAYNRLEGVALVVAGVVFYWYSLRNGGVEARPDQGPKPWKLNFFMLLASMAGLLVGSHYVIRAATDLAISLAVPASLIGVAVVGVGTTLPELLFAIKSVRQKDDELAIGDIFGTVLADATIVVGVLALIRPFAFPAGIAYTAGIAMVLASFLLIYFMRTGKELSRNEALLLLVFWVAFIAGEVIISQRG